MNKILSTLNGKTIFITGASRGIGRQIALRCAEDGANVVLVGRSLRAPSRSRLDGTLEEVAKEVNSLGGRALPLKCDIRNVKDVTRAVKITINKFKGIDAVINNASAIDMKPFARPSKNALMMNVNVIGTMNVIQSTSRILEKSDVSHLLSISPPLSTLGSDWLVRHPVYTTSKYSMTMLTLGYSNILRANTIWPKKMIATAATKMLQDKTGISYYENGKSPVHFSKCVHTILCSDSSNRSVLDNNISQMWGGTEDIFT